MKKILTRMDKPLFFATTIIFLFGLIMIFSASYVKAIIATGSPYYYLIRQGIILIGSSFASIIVVLFPTKSYKKLGYIIFFITLLLLVLVLFYGAIVKGSKRWFPLGFFNLQPSEVIKVSLIMFMGVFYDKNKDKMKDYKRPLIPIVFAIICAILVFVQPDLGGTLIILGIAFIIYLAVPIVSHIRMKINMILFGAIALVALIFGVASLSGKSFLYSYQIQRLNFFKPCARYSEVGTGYQVCNGYIAINNGGLFGVGIGNSTQKYLYLPEAHNDFIFPVIIEELGALIGILILLMYLFIIVRILIIARRSHNLMNGIICYGVAFYIFIHVFVNLGGVLGLLPLTGVPLPFLSYGGSYALSLSIALTLVQRVKIDTYAHMQEERIKSKIKEY